METLDLTAEEKHYLAVDEVFRELLEEFNIELPEEAISLLIQIAVKMLPPTHQPQ
jgi:thermostable 8-oxoguanine DNA glycosylase